MYIHPEKLPFSLTAEAALFLRDNTNDSTSDIKLWARAIRADLVAGELKSPEDLHSLTTNCLGAAALFNCAIDGRLKPANMLLLRSSWQHPENQTSIHITSAVDSNESEEKLFVDPMPAVGYLYGTVGKVENITDDIYVSKDETIEAHNYFRMLQDSDVATILEFYYAKAIIHTLPAEAYNKLRGMLDALDQFPGYQAKACILLDRLEEEVAQDNYWLNNRAILNGIPDKRIDALKSNAARKHIAERIGYETEQVSILLTVVAEIISDLNNPYDKNYWQGVSEMLAMGHRGMSGQVSARISHLDFQGPNPIEQYESYMLTNHPGYCKSDIYRDKH